MSALTFFEKYMGRQQQKVETTMAKYRELVVAIAAGNEPNPDEVDRLLLAVSKTIDDLQQDVRWQQRRTELKARVASLPKLERERLEIDKKLAAADQAFDAAEKLHDETTAPLYARRREIDTAISEASRASSELIQTCDDAKLEQELTAVHAELTETSLRAQTLADRARQLEHKAERAREYASLDIVQSMADRHRQQAAQYQTESETARQEERKLTKRLADLRKRSEELERQMRDV